MPTESAQRLTTYCRERAGEDLRSVVEYNDDGYVVAYLREDLQTQYNGDEFDDLVQQAQEVHKQLVAAGGTGSPLGNAQATVHYFEHAFVIQLVVDEQQGYFATFNSSVGQTLGAFITDCLKRVHSADSAD
jgi:hypothetical protein